MSLSMLKAIRDGGITGGVTAAVTVWLMHQGAEAETAAFAGVLCGGLAARLYRAARARWTWLAEIDPPAPEPRAE